MRAMRVAAVAGSPKMSRVATPHLKAAANLRDPE